MKTKAALFAHQESSYSAKRSHIVSIKCMSFSSERQNTVFQWALKKGRQQKRGTLKWPQAKRLNTKTFSAECDEEKTALFARQESPYCARKSHFLLIKWHGQVIKQESYRSGTSDVQAFSVENKIQYIFFLFFCFVFFFLHPKKIM